MTKLEQRRQKRPRQEADIPTQGKAKQERIDLGLAILSLMEIPEGGRPSMDIAHVCGCSDETIRAIICRGIQKLRTNPRTMEIARELAGQIGYLDSSRI